MALYTSRPFVATKHAPSVRLSLPAKTRLNVKASAASGELARRDAIGLASLAVFLGFQQAQPAQAFLGFGEDGQVEAKYQQQTADILASVNKVLSIPKDAEDKDEAVKKLRVEINNWVASYRREPKVSGKPSYGNTYAALNAVAGHYNSFGATTAIPKKRLERLQKELADAELLLSRGR